MSVHVSAYVWEHSQHKGTELLLLLALADMANKEGYAWPSVGTLGKFIRMSERNTRRALRALEASGELATRPNAGPTGCHLYQVRMIQNLPLFKRDEGADNLAPDNLSGGHPGQEGRTSEAKGADTAVSSEPSTNQLQNREKPVDKFQGNRPLRSLAVEEFNKTRLAREQKRAERAAQDKRRTEEPA